MSPWSRRGSAGMRGAGAGAQLALAPLRPRAVGQGRGPAAGPLPALRMPRVRRRVGGRPVARGRGRAAADGTGRVVGGRLRGAGRDERAQCGGDAGVFVGLRERRGPGQGHEASGRRRTPPGRGHPPGRGRARVAAHVPWLQIRDRGRGPDAQEGRAAGPSPGRGRGQERRGVRRMARLPLRGVQKERAGRGDGRVRRIQARRQEGRAPRQGGPRPVPRRQARRRQAASGRVLS